MNKSVGCILITHNAAHHLPYCLGPLLSSPLKPRILVMNSSSEDGTVELAQQMGVETCVVPRKSFNHGTTREMARKRLGTDIVVMMTPDAYMSDAHTLEKLVEPLMHDRASVSYARQIPHPGASFFEAFPRAFNYPNESHIRGIQDATRYGVYTFFCSNSCAAYLNNALDCIGGFERLLLGEDTVAVSKLLRQGHKIAYVSQALVHHSHRYTLLEEFRRSFDTGLARKGYEHLLECPSTDTRRGMHYAKTMIRELIAKSPVEIPYASLHLFSKWSGYRLGRLSLKAPVWFKRFFSSQDFFWQGQ